MAIGSIIRSLPKAAIRLANMTQEAVHRFFTAHHRLRLVYGQPSRVRYSIILKRDDLTTTEDTAFKREDKISVAVFSRKD